MKSKDWTTIAVIAGASALFSFIISNFVISSRITSTLKVESVSPITSDFTLPSNKYFNANSINPTKEIKIGEDPNQDPFKNN